MLAFLEEARFHRHAGMSQRFEEHDAVVDIDQSIISRMEERGIVERVHDAEDRRVVLAQVTPVGREVVHKVEATRLDHMRQLVGALTADEQQTVLGALKTLTSAHARLHSAQDDHRHSPHSTNYEEHVHS